MFKFVIIAVIVGVVSAQYGGQHGGYEQHEEYAEPQYRFEYSVHDPHTGDIKSQSEERKGDSTHGEYSLVEPDGSRRNVQYHVEGKSGFLAEVHREPAKEGYRPSYEQPSYRPSYQQPSNSRPAYSSYHH